jgi:hypothetical protein
LEGGDEVWLGTVILGLHLLADAFNGPLNVGLLCVGKHSQVIGVLNRMGDTSYYLSRI